ncbi:uracil-DNA glycosylase [Rhodoluna limnophila]|uniref:uracil-DNA glycosylase n=1 Tax=Rhodoluna limnophila TaxID=232537 RepID=UPI0011063E7B|nr:uracil-DNA glycosylase [Rhodoluna limnophila]
MFFEQMHPSWQQALATSKPLLDELELKVAARESEMVPAMVQVMKAFEMPLNQVRVLIVGQDPYPTAGHAIGLSFAVANDVKPLPRSLKNMMIELKDDLGKSVSSEGDLTRWVHQGVFLLNRHLTTDLFEPGAHSNLGWAHFTDRVIAVLNRQVGRNLVAILWGNQAQELKGALCDCTVIASAHPSPLSARRGFFGSKPYSTANAALVSAGLSPVDWSC